MSDLIAGRYRVERRLGIGGMSSVHLAMDERLERLVAVKLLAEHLAEDPNFVQRFQREALAAARLVHPNVVQVFDSGLDEASHQHYIVMEYVNGHSCAEILRDEGRLPVEEAVGIVTQACRGLDYAHRHGVVHRDVKPGNLMVTEDHHVKLADFGIARAMDQSSITQAGSVLGTAAYLAPEQARGEEAGPPADLYALGVVAYQLLAGRLPYEASSLPELVLKQQREAPDRLDALDPEIPPALSDAINRALALEPEGRYEDAPAMSSALRAALRGVSPPPATAATSVIGATGATSVLGGEPGTAPTRRAPGAVPVEGRPRAAGPLTPPHGRPAARREAPRRRRGRARRVAALLLIFLLAGAGAALAVLATSESDSGVRLREVMQTELDDAANQLRGLIDDNTR